MRGAHRFTLPALSLFLGLGGACTEPAAEPLVLPAGCQPLLGGHECLLPYPSDFFVVADSTLPSGRRVEMTGAAKLLDKNGVSADIHEFLPSDGFSSLSTITTLLPDEVSTAGMARILDPPEQSMQLEHPTLLLEADTGRLIPHFVDLDLAGTDPVRQAIVLHPIVGLAAETRYIVAVHGVRRPDGALSAPAEGFRRIRDSAVLGEPTLSALADRFEDEVFPALADLGLDRDSLQLAWDFTTGSDELVTRDMFAVRELTLAWLAANQPTIEITRVFEDELPSVWRRIEGKLTVPLFLEDYGTGALLWRDTSGTVVQNGTAEAQFVIVVPRSVRDQAEPGRALLFGHGFFSSRNDAISDSSLALADRLGAVLLAIDWIGMSQGDIDTMFSGLSSNLWKGLLFTDRVHQAMANWLVLTAATRGALAELPELRRPTGEPVYHTEALGYLGVSMGHILGGIMGALNPDLERLCLNVGGAGYTHIMERSDLFSAFAIVLNANLPDTLAQRKFMTIAQEQMDRIDPGRYAQYLLDEPLPGSRDRRVLMQIGLGDTTFPNVGSFLHARLLALPQLQPSSFAVWGLDAQEGPIDGSALTVFDYGEDLDALYKEPLAGGGNDIHGSLRAHAAALDQMDVFFQPNGMVENPCDGPCVVNE
jgi:hypothetical protein